MIRNVLALIGVLAMMGGAYAYLTYKPVYDHYQPVMAKMQGKDPARLVEVVDMMDGVDMDAMTSIMQDWDINGLIALGREIDPKAPEVYKGMIERLKVSRNAAAATVWKYPVEDGLTVEEVELSMKSIASEHNIRAVGELPLSEQVARVTGEAQRFLKIYMFCNPQTAMKMVSYNAAYSAYLPCRISLLEDKEGRLWLYALDMDMMIWGGATLPDALLQDALKVREVMIDIMARAAEGDF